MAFFLMKCLLVLLAPLASALRMQDDHELTGKCNMNACWTMVANHESGVCEKEHCTPCPFCAQHRRAAAEEHIAPVVPTDAIPSKAPTEALVEEVSEALVQALESVEEPAPAAPCPEKSVWTYKGVQQCFDKSKFIGLADDEIPEHVSSVCCSNQIRESVAEGLAQQHAMGVAQQHAQDLEGQAKADAIENARLATELCDQLGKSNKKDPKHNHTPKCSDVNSKKMRSHGFPNFPDGFHCVKDHVRTRAGHINICVARVVKKA